MRSFFKYFFRRNNKQSPPKKLNAATANKVLQFLSHGLTFGVESLASHYRPSNKVDEFVAVSGAILSALKSHDTHFSDAVVISVHVNEVPKLIKLMQIGEHVLLALDGYQTIISLITLDEIYLRLRNDIIHHEQIYGKDVHMMAASSPASK